MEKETASRSSVLAWRIPWTEEPGGLLSMRLLESDTTEQLHNNRHRHVPSSTLGSLNCRRQLSERV